MIPKWNSVENIFAILPYVMIWFVPNFYAWILDIPYESLDFKFILLSRYFVIMTLISLFFCLWLQKKSSSNGINDGALLVLISITGGIVISKLIVASIPNPTFSAFFFISLVMIFVSGFQMVMAGAYFLKILSTKNECDE